MSLRPGLLALLGPFVLAAPARASTIVALPEATLTQRAAVIAFGSLIDARTEVTREGAVITRARLQVLKAVRGAEPGAIVTLQLPGGRLPNGLVAQTAGAPLLAPGQLWLGFFEAWPDGSLRPLGLGYGLLRVRADGRGGYRVWRDLEGLGLVGPRGEVVAPSVYTLEDEPLADVLVRLAHHLAPPSTVAPIPAGATGGSETLRR